MPASPSRERAAGGSIASARVPAAAQTLAILGYLGRQATPARAAAITRDLGLPRSTTYHLLGELVDAGFVVHLPEQQRYGLGVAAYELGAGYTRQAPLARLARQPLEALVRRIGQSCHLAVLDGRDVVYVVEERAPGRPPLVTDVGVRLPAHLTASGRALLARLPAARVRAAYPDAAAFVARTDVPGPTSPSALRALLVGVRRAGFASEDGEVTPGYAWSRPPRPTTPACPRRPSPSPTRPGPEPTRPRSSRRYAAPPPRSPAAWPPAADRAPQPRAGPACVRRAR